MKPPRVVYCQACGQRFETRATPTMFARTMRRHRQEAHPEYPGSLVYGPEPPPNTKEKRQ